MKFIVGSLVLEISMLLSSFHFSEAGATPRNYTIDAVAGAFGTGSVEKLSPFLDEQVDITLPEKTDTYSKTQSEMIIRDFFQNNRVERFRVTQKGENQGSEYCFGILQTRNGNFQTSLFMKQKGEQQFLEEIRLQHQP